MHLSWSTARAHARLLNAGSFQMLINIVPAPAVFVLTPVLVVQFFCYTTTDFPASSPTTWPSGQKTSVQFPWLERCLGKEVWHSSTTMDRHGWKSRISLLVQQQNHGHVLEDHAIPCIPGLHCCFQSHFQASRGLTMATLRMQKQVHVCCTGHTSLFWACA